MGYNDESAADKRKRWEAALEQGRQKAAEGNRYKQYMEEHFGITAQQRQQAYEASGMDLLRKDLTTLDNDLRTKPMLAQRGRVSGMISAVQKQRAYFQKYANYFTPEELQGFDTELRRHEELLTGTMTAMEKKTAQTTAQEQKTAAQPRTIMERAQTGMALGAPRGQMTMPIDQTQRRELGFLTPQEQRAAAQRGAELQKTYGDQYDVDLAAKKKQEAEANARQLYERKKSYVEKREAEGWNSPQERENEYRRLEYYSRRLGTAQAEKMRFARVQKEYGEAKTMENLTAEMQKVTEEIAASQERVKQLTVQRNQAEHPGGRREGNQWVNDAANTEKMTELDQEIKNEQRRQKILEGQQKRVTQDYQAAYYYKYTDLQNRDDFAEKSKYRTTRKSADEYRGGVDSLYKDVYYDYINGDPDAQTLVKVQDDNNTKATHEMWKDLPEETVGIFNYLYATEGKDAAYEYLDQTVEHEYTWMQSMGYGLAQGTGLASVASAVRTGAASFFGGEDAKKEAIMDYRTFKENAAAAAQQNPVSYYAGSTVGNLGLMAASGGVAGKAVGTAGGALGSRVATGALSFATAQAIRDAGNAATGEITAGEYGKNILVSGIQGAAGNLAQELVSTGIAQRLTEKGLMTPFMDFLRNTTASMTFSTVNQAIGYLAADEKPTTGEVISGLLSSFAFAMIDGGLRTMRTTKAAKQRIESMIDDVKAQYSALTANGERLTKEQTAERVAAVYQYSQDVKAVLDETYLAGQQETVDQMRAALDFIANEAGNWIAQNVKPGTNSAPAAASGGLTGGMLALTETGTQGQPGMETPTQPQGGGTPEQVQQLHAEIAEAMTAGAEKGELNNGRTESMRENEGRNAGLDSGIQAGGLESGGSRRAADTGGAGDGEQDRAANLRAERINNRIAQFGRLNWNTANSELIEGGDPETYCAVIPEERYDEGMQRAVENARSKGISVTYIAGQLNVKGDDGEYYSADAVTDTSQKKIVAKADSLTFDPEQLVEHEEFHNLVHGRGELVRSIADEIRKNFDEAEYRQTVEQYLRAYRGVVEDDEQIEAETLADAYAGMNRFRNTNTAQYRETVQRAVGNAENIPQTDENAAAIARRGVGDSEKFSIRNTRSIPWEEQVRGYFQKDGTVKSSDSLYLGESRVEGLENAPLYIPTSVITKAIRESKGSRSAHGLQRADILGLKDEIKDAPLVIVNPERNAVVYVTDHRTDSGYLVAAFDLNNDLFGENAHRATSIHGRESIVPLLEHLNADATVYVKNEGRVNQMLPGNQILKSLELLAKVETAYGESIAENDRNVKKGNAKFSYAGELTKTANVQALRDAQEMENIGADMESIRRVTGWHKGGDGKWRFETDDSDTAGETETEDNAKRRAPATELQEGNENENAAQELSRGVTVSGSLADTTSAASNGSIRQDAEKSQGGKIKFSLAASEEAGELTVVNNLSEADLREGLNSGAITLLDDDSEGAVSVVYRSGSEVNGTVPIASVQQVILPRSSSLGTFRDLTEMGINAIDYTANDERTREELVNEAIGMAGRQTQADADAAAARKLNRQRVESIGDADAPRERNVLQSQQTEKIEEMRKSPDQLRQKIGEAVEAYWDRQKTLKAEKERFGTEYGYYKPLSSRSTKLSPMEAVEALESVTGQVWSIQRRKDGTWKAVQQDGLALAPRYSKAEALKILEDNKRKAIGDPVLNTTAAGTGKKDFVGTPAMEKLGIKIDGSVADYEATPEILASTRARKQVESSIKKLQKRQNWQESSAEVKFAWCIANGKVSPQDIPQRMNYRAVNELANLYMSERMLGEDLLTMRKRAIRNGVLNEVMQLFPTENGIAAGTETFRAESLPTLHYRTARRSMLRIFGDKAGAKINQYLFDPVIRNTAEQVRWTNRQLDRVRTFESSEGKQEKLNKAESKYVHMLLDLEGYKEKINRSENKGNLLSAAENLAKQALKGANAQLAAQEEAKEFGLGSEEMSWVSKYAQYLAAYEKASAKDSGIDTEKCERARAEYRKAFDEYYDAVVDLLVAHGEQPIGKIEFYAPHMTTNDKVNLLNNLLETMGYNGNMTELPASIAGRTEDLRPNKRWTPFFQHRTTDKTEYDIVGAFESYLTYIGDVIFHIDDIRKLRVAESFLRQGTAGDYSGALETAIQMSKSGDFEEKEAFLSDIGKIGNDEILSDEEINLRLDNLIDELIGEQENRTRYSSLVRWMKTYTDVLAGKQYTVDRAFENFFGREGKMAKAVGMVRKGSRMFGMSKVAMNVATALNQSAQLALLIPTRSKASILQAIGEFTTGKLKDFSLESDFLAGKRGISYINSKTGEKILNAMFTPAEFTDRMLATIATRAAYLDAVAGRKGLKEMDHEDAMRFADLYARSLMGDRTKGAKPVAFHAKNTLMQMVNRFQIENLNTWEFVTQDIPEDFRRVRNEHGKATAVRMLIGVIAETLIAAFIMNRLAEETYGGTPAPFDLIGLSANFIASGNGLSTNDGIRYLFNQVSQELFGEEVFENVPEPSESFDLGRAWNDTAENISNDIPFVSNIAGLVGWGDETLPMPDLYGKVKNLTDAIDESGWFSRDANLAALGLFAEIAPGGNQMQKTGKGLLALAEGGRITGAKDKERLQFATDGSVANAIRQGLFGVYSTPESRAFYASGRSGLSTPQTELWKELREEGVDGTELYETMQTIRAIDKRDDLTTQQQGMAKRRLINEANLTDAQKARMYSVMINDSRDEDFEKMMEAGMSWAKVMEVYEEYKELYDDEDLSAAEQALELARWIEKQRYTKQQKQLVREAFQFYSMAPANTEIFDNYVGAGMTEDEAAATVKQAKENAGDDQVTTEDKVQAVLAQKLSEKKTYAALGTILSEKAYEKLTEAYRAGIPCKVFYEFYRMARDTASDRDEDGKEIKGQTRKDKITEYINGLNLTSEQKTVLLLTEYPKTDPDSVWWGN